MSMSIGGFGNYNYTANNSNKTAEKPKTSRKDLTEELQFNIGKRDKHHGSIQSIKIKQN